MFQAIINLSFLIGCLAFVWGLRLLSSPDSARRGNTLASLGMGLAIVATMILPLSDAPNNYLWIFGGMIIGGIIGWITARKIQMTAMPQMVSVFNGLGGGCAMVLAFVELVHFYNPADDPGYDKYSEAMTSGSFSVILFALVLGSISFTGSMLAFGKLQGLVNDKMVTLPKHSIINLVLLIATVGLSIWVFLQSGASGINLAIILTVLALVYGVSFVAPIGEQICRL